jgi:hypothetical protein
MIIGEEKIRVIHGNRRKGHSSACKPMGNAIPGEGGAKITREDVGRRNI